MTTRFLHLSVRKNRKSKTSKWSYSDSANNLKTCWLNLMFNTRNFFSWHTVPGFSKFCWTLWLQHIIKTFCPKIFVFWSFRKKHFWISEKGDKFWLSDLPTKNLDCSNRYDSRLLIIEQKWVRATDLNPTKPEMFVPDTQNN